MTLVFKNRIVTAQHKLLLLTMAASSRRLQASLGLLLALAIAGGWFLYNGTIPKSADSVNATDGRILNQGDAAVPDCSHDGTCDAGSMYKETEDTVKKETEGVKEMTKEVVESGDQVDEKEKEECVDNHESCDMWASKGECKANPKYMLRNCQKSCMVCGEV